MPAVVLGQDGDRWLVVRRLEDGSLCVRRSGDPPNGRLLTLPANYVAAHVELAYATTTHPHETSTVDTAHALVRPEMSRDLLDVAMTRARQYSTAYVCFDTEADDEHGPGPEPHRPRRARTGHRSPRRGHLRPRHNPSRAGARRLHRPARRRIRHARQARHHRWITLAKATFPGADTTEITRSASWPALVAAWRRAKAAGLDLDTAAPRFGGSPAVGLDPVTVVRDLD